MKKKYFLESSENKIDYTQHSPFDFFISEIQKKTYAPEQKDYGVNIFPYRLASCADFDYQFVINASQKNLSVPFKKLDFISDAKRIKLLGLDKEEIPKDIQNEMNVAKNFVRLYGLSQKESPQKKVFFSAAEESLDGFSIVHTELNRVEFDSEEQKELDLLDFISAEKSLSGLEKSKTDKEENKIEISSDQKDAFENWSNILIETGNNKTDSCPSKTIIEKVEAQLTQKGKEVTNSKYKVSQTELKNFFKCPRIFLFKEVIGLEEDSLDVSLIKPYEIGTFIHRIIELVLRKWKDEEEGKIPIFKLRKKDESKKTSEVNDSDINNCVNECFEEAKKGNRAFKESKLALSVIESQKEFICNIVSDFLKEFCCEPDNKTKNKCFGGFKIKGVEYEVAVPCKEDGSKFDFYGKIDCVLAPSEVETADKIDNLVIVDFKTGGTVPTATESIAQEESKVSLIEDFQIACYVKLLENNPKNEKEVNVNNALFYQIKKDENNEFPVNQVIAENKPSNNSKAVNHEGFKSTLNELENYAEYFFDKCMDNDFDPIAFNSEDDEHKKYGISVFEDCVKCHFNSICRTSFNISKNEL